ncbi:hypothetical protein U1Q18_050314 [Sarracenia purpurea var. burkii]
MVKDGVTSYLYNAKKRTRKSTSTGSSDTRTRKWKKNADERRKKERKNGGKPPARENFHKTRPKVDWSLKERDEEGGFQYKNMVWRSLRNGHPYRLDTPDSGLVYTLASPLGPYRRDFLGGSSLV